MIYSYGKCGKIEKAKKLMVEMKALNVSLSVVTYNSLLSCNPSVKDAETVFHQVKHSMGFSYLNFNSIIIDKYLNSRLSYLEITIRKRMENDDIIASRM